MTQSKPKNRRARIECWTNQPYRLGYGQCGGRMDGDPERTGVICQFCKFEYYLPQLAVTKMVGKLKTKSRFSGITNGKKRMVKTLVKKIVPVKPAKLDPAKLADDRAALEREMEKLREALQELPEVSIEEADPALIEREKNLALLQQLERRLEEIDLARKAAKKGRYGICERCGKAIDPERLEIFPETRYCVKCKTELEQAARRNQRR